MVCDSGDGNSSQLAGLCPAGPPPHLRTASSSFPNLTASDCLPSCTSPRDLLGVLHLPAPRSFHTPHARHVAGTDSFHASRAWLKASTRERKRHGKHFWKSSPVCLGALPCPPLSLSYHLPLYLWWEDHPLWPERPLGTKSKEALSNSHVKI